jgi:hypothetical protein
MTDSDTRVETFKTIPGFSWYEFGDRGTIRSIDRTVNGKPYRGTTLSPSSQNQGYLKLGIVHDEYGKVTRTVHTLICEAFHGPRPPGLEARHLNDDPLDNRAENLAWGTKADNVADRMRNHPATPKPPKVCVRCSQPFEGSGKRCHPCVTEIGEKAATLLEAGVDLDEACRRLSYPSETGLHKLARRYGGYGVSSQPAPPLPSQTVTDRRGALATLRDRLRGQR